MGKVELEVAQIDQIPVLMGEKDILKTIQLLRAYFFKENRLIY